MRVLISQEELKERMEEILKLRLKHSFDSSPVHIIITDENANVLYANKAVEESTGFSQEEVVGKNPADLWGHKMPKKFYDDMWHTIKIDKKPFVGEVQNMKKDGTSFWQELFVFPILDNDGNVKFFIGMEPNIMERKKRAEFKDQFISAIGHQVRNPVITIKWILEKLLSSSNLSEEERKEVEKIYRENQTLANLINDLLILSCVENLAPQSETFKLDEEISNAIENVRNKRPDVSITFEKGADSMTISSVRSLAVQVFLNIIYNAAEHANEEQGRVVIKLEKYQQGLIFSCYNNGKSIPEEMRSKIFTKVTSTSGGMGLGLFIVKMISDYFGWRLWFDTDDKGTTFYVEIPDSN